MDSLASTIIAISNSFSTVWFPVISFYWKKLNVLKSYSDHLLNGFFFFFCGLSLSVLVVILWPKKY